MQPDVGVATGWQTHTNQRMRRQRTFQTVYLWFRKIDGNTKRTGQPAAQTQRKFLSEKKLLKRPSATKTIVER
jgi:hypothetical protein